MADLIEVSRDEFFKPIYDKGLDVHPSIKTGFPYTSDWEFHRQLTKPIYGKTVDSYDRGNTDRKYFIDRKYKPS